MVVNETEADAVRRWLDDPLLFIGHFWPDAKLYAKQRDIILSVRDNIETFVHSANEMGKTWLAARIVLWFFCTRFPARVIVFSSSERQLKNALWPEITSAIRTAARDLDVVPRQSMQLERLDPAGVPYEDHYARLFVTKQVETFQGVHLATMDDLPRVLFIMEEASGIPDEFYEAATSQAQRILAIGNPLNVSNFFYRECKAGDLPDDDRPGRFLRKVVHIDGSDSPNVQVGLRHKRLRREGPPPTVVPGVLSYSQYMHRERKWDEIKKRIRLHGQFYEGSETLMFPPDWLDLCEEAWHEVPHELANRGPFSLGLDLAEGGRDLTVWAVVDRFGVVEIVARKTPDTTVIVPKTIELMARYGIPGKRVCLDRGGGKVHADNLRQRGYRVRLVSFGERPRDPKSYKNRRAEMYGLLREAIRREHWSRNIDLAADGTEICGEWLKCFAIPPDEHELREELAVLPFLHDEFGRVWMLPKRSDASKRHQETVEDLIGRSPDRADALVLANFARSVPLKPPTPRVDHPLVAVDAEDDSSRSIRQPSSLEQRIFGDSGGGSLAERIGYE